MQTNDFRTKTLCVPRNFPCPEKHWAIGLDIGYSGVKGISPNKYFCFPAYAKRIPENHTVLKEPSDTDIRYRDETGEWVVGELAYDELNATGQMDSEAELYGRNRYYSDLFRVISRTGIALGFMDNDLKSYNDQKISVQTGLPPKYKNLDSEYLTDVLSGTHIFELKIGKKPWQKFTYTLGSENIAKVMAQPLGALLSASIDKNGKPLPDGKKYLDPNSNTNVLVFDPGFGTTDTYPIRSGIPQVGETFPEYSMHEVLARTCRDIESRYGREFSVSQLLNQLKTGTITVTNRRKMSSDSVDISPMLQKNCKGVCMDVVEKLKSVYDYFSDYSYIICTGGTYDAWKEDFDEVFKDMKTLQIISGNANDPSLSNVFSNVRGYYYNLINHVR